MKNKYSRIALPFLEYSMMGMGWEVCAVVVVLGSFIVVGNEALISNENEAITSTKMNTMALKPHNFTILALICVCRGKKKMKKEGVCFIAIYNPRY